MSRFVCGVSFFRLVFGAEARLFLDGIRQLALAGDVIDQHFIQLSRGPLEGGAQERLTLLKSPNEFAIVPLRTVHEEPGAVGEAVGDGAFPLLVMPELSPIVDEQDGLLVGAEALEKPGQGEYAYVLDRKSVV